jgi:uncharacterized membrane protein
MSRRRTPSVRRTSSARRASPVRRDTVPVPSPAAPSKPRRWVPWFLTAAAYVGFVMSLYLTFVHYRGYVSPCYVVHGCETVQTSRYSVVLGVPVALLGTIFFGVMFYLGIGVLTRYRVTLVRAFKVLAFVGALAMIPLLLLQAIVLRAFCSYCVATEVVMLSIWIVSFLLASPAQRRDAQAAAAPAGR